MSNSARFAVDGNGVATVIKEDKRVMEAVFRVTFNTRWSVKPIVRLYDGERQLKSGINALKGLYGKDAITSIELIASKPFQVREAYLD